MTPNKIAIVGRKKTQNPYENKKKTYKVQGHWLMIEETLSQYHCIETLQKRLTPLWTRIEDEPTNITVAKCIGLFIAALDIFFFYRKPSFFLFVEVLTALSCRVAP